MILRGPLPDPCLVHAGSGCILGKTRIKEETGCLGAASAPIPFDLLFRAAVSDKGRSRRCWWS